MKKSICLVGLSCLFCIMGMTFAVRAQKTEGRIHEKKIDTTMVVNGRQVILSQEIWELNKDSTGDFYSTVRSYSLKNAAGVIQYSKTYPEPEIRKNGFSDIFNIRPFTVSTPAREALVVSLAMYPSAPGTWITLHLFSWSGDTLVAVGDPLEVYGSFGDFSRNQKEKEMTLSDSETMLMTSHVAYHFYVDIPLIINLDPSAKTTFRTSLSKDPQSNLVIIPVTANRMTDFMDETAEITLYNSAIGTGSLKVRVDKETEIEVGPAYGHVQINENLGEISFKINRLKVTVDGKTGFIEQKDYTQIGLPAFG